MQYNRAAEWWQLLFRVFESATGAAGAAGTGIDEGGKKPKGFFKWSLFWYVLVGISLFLYVHATQHGLG